MTRTRPSSQGAQAQRSWTLVCFLLEAALAFTLVVVVASGALENSGDDEPRLPIALAMKDVPALLVMAGALAVCTRFALRFRYAITCGVTMATALIVRPPSDVHPWLAPLAGAVVGVLFATWGVSIGDYARIAPAARTRLQTFRLGVAASLLGTLPCAARYGALLGAPASVLGVLLLWDVTSGLGQNALARWQRWLGRGLAALAVLVLLAAVGISLDLVVPPP